MKTFSEMRTARQPYDKKKDENAKVYDDGDFRVWFHGNGNFAISEIPDDEWYIDRFKKPARTVQQAKQVAKTYMKKWRTQ